METKKLTWHSDLNKEQMRLEHQIKNVVNRIDEKSSHTPGQKDGVQEHPISKKTSDYEEKFFQHASEKDDREKFITGKKPEHKDNVEDTEGHSNPVKKKETKSPVEAEEVEDLDEMKPGYANGSTKPSDLAMCGYITNKTHMFIMKAQYKYEYWPVIGQNKAKESDQVMFKWEKDTEAGSGWERTVSGVPLQGKYKGKRFTYKIVTDTHRVASDELKKNRLLDEYNPEKDDMNIDLKQVENLQEKKKIENEDFMAKIAHAAKKGKKEVKIGDKVHKVTMDKDTAHKIASEIETKESMSWEDAVKLATDTRSQSTKEYWEEKVKERQEGWGGKGGVPGKGSVTTVRPKKSGGMTMGGKK